ncbi:Lrp/AsnC family transcriptional regulator [Yoonia sp. SDW83-1]|uniref:Lrp/AsnC family transcriptional regulator n=1 Tax=Yoonia sp. SDW83-1 TaxID=3366945 RepID=UPI00398C4904
MDAIDRRIILALQQDGRLSNVDLAVRVGLSPSPCLRRVKLLEERGIITGYQAVIDRHAINLSLTVFVEITVARHSRQNAALVGQSLSSIPGLVACHMVSGDADFLAEIVVADLSSYERLLTEHILTIEAVEQIRSNFSLRPITTSLPLTLPSA